MLWSAVIAVIRSILNDPSPGVYWTDAEDLIPYANQFQHWAVGMKPDLYPIRATVQLAEGTDQVLPTNGLQFLDAYYAPGNGQAVFVLTLAQIKHAKFANMAALPPVDNVQAVAADPRNDKGYFTFPGSTGASASQLRILYGGFAPAVTDFTQAYLLPAETTMAATDFILSRAYRKNTDRQDLNRSDALMASAKAWFPARAQAEFPADAQPDE